jgi:Zn finger protein HypA/HybF involved in hydrogenase expression
MWVISLGMDPPVYFFASLVFFGMAGACIAMIIHECYKLARIRSVKILKCPACGHEFVVKKSTRTCPACNVDMDVARKELRSGTETLYKRPEDASLKEK